MAAEEDYSLYDENSDRFVIKVPAAQARILDVGKCWTTVTYVLVDLSLNRVLCNHPFVSTQTT